ncbi:MAG: branched-chain amino acid ABC transporter permease, partial [Pseudomonadota bacterium]
MILQTVVNGISIGLMYVLMASGLTLVFGILRIVNFAHGQFYMLGAFIFYVVLDLAGLGFLVAFAASILGIGILGLMMERGLFRPLEGKSLLGVIGTTLGLMMFLEGAAELIFGPDDQKVSTVFPGLIKIGGMMLAVERLVMIGMSAAVMFALYYWIQRTRSGTATRAVSQDEYAASLMGIKKTRCSLVVMGVGSALAGAAGAILSPIFFITPYMGGVPLIKALIVITLGGMGSIMGATLGGLILGIMEAFAYTYLGGIAEIIGFLIIIVLLIVRPQG